MLIVAIGIPGICFADYSDTIPTVFKVGTKWEWRATAGGRAFSGTEEVVRATPSGYTIRRIFSDGVTVTREINLDLNPVRNQKRSGITIEYNPPYPLLYFPLRLGTTSTHEYTSERGRHYRVLLEVVSIGTEQTTTGNQRVVTIRATHTTSTEEGVDGTETIKYVSGLGVISTSCKECGESWEMTRFSPATEVSSR